MAQADHDQSIMKVLLIGATGNLGSRSIPALLAQGHQVTAFVRSEVKLRTLVSNELYNRIEVTTGDATNTCDVYRALKDHECDALVTTAGNREAPWREQTLGQFAAAISEAAIRVGKGRHRPLQAWFIGGLGSLEYPGTGGWKIQDYMPGFMTAHHRQTEAVLRQIKVEDLAWTLLCVAFMTPRRATIEALAGLEEHGLVVAIGKPPAWQDSWVRGLPTVGLYLNVVPAVRNYTTTLESVSGLIAERLESEEFVGKLVGFKDGCLLYTSPSPRDGLLSRMPSSA